MHLLFFSVYGHEGNYFLEADAALREHGISAGHVLMSRYAQRQQRNIQADIFDFQALLDGVSVVHPLEESTRLAEKYGIPSIRFVYLADPTLNRVWDEASLLRYTVEGFLAWENFFDHYDFDAIITDLGSEIARMVLIHVARYRNIPTLHINRLPLPNSLALNTDYRLPLSIDRADVSNVTSKQKEFARKFINDFRKRPDQLFLSQLQFAPPIVNSQRIKKLIEDALVHWRFEKNGALAPYWAMRTRIPESIRRIVNKALVRKLYTEPMDGDKYVLLPFHYSVDFQLTVRAPHCYDQIAIAKLCARSLPEGMKLYLKEHPNYVGGISPSALGQVLEYANVRLLPPTIRASEAIKKASLVVVINSTLGLEALLHGKPVITLGNPFYSGLGLTIDVNNFSELPDAVSRGLSWKTCDGLLNAFVATAMNKTYPGAPSYLDPTAENVSAFAESVLSKLAGAP